MRILFIYSANNNFGISPIVSRQADALINLGHQIDIGYFPIFGRGIFGYLKSTIKLKFHLRKHQYDILHAHYAFAGYVATLAKSNEPLVVSLMGSDALFGTPFRQISFILSKYSWAWVILKSEALNVKLQLMSRFIIIPNGVNLDIFRPTIKSAARASLGLSPGKKYILFAANPERTEKDFEFAKAVFNSLTKNEWELLVVYDRKPEEMPLYLNACDCLILTSRYEGSPNIVKEAMACNCPVVSTNVGDVVWLLDGVDNCYISERDPVIFANFVEKVINKEIQEHKISGRERVKNLKLDSNSMARKIFEIYSTVNERRDEEK